MTAAAVGYIWRNINRTPSFRLKFGAARARARRTTLARLHYGFRRRNGGVAGLTTAPAAHSRTRQTRLPCRLVNGPCSRIAKIDPSTDDSAPPERDGAFLGYIVCGPGELRRRVTTAPPRMPPPMTKRQQKIGSSCAIRTSPASRRLSAA